MKVRSRRWRGANYHLKAKANQILVAARAKNQIVTPDNCEDCSRPFAQLRREYSKKANVIHRHHDDYAKPLDVVHLCPACHTRRHRSGGWPGATTEHNDYLAQTGASLVAALFRPDAQSSTVAAA